MAHVGENSWPIIGRKMTPPNVSSPYVYYLGVKGKHWLVNEGYCELAEINQTAGVAGGNEPPMPHDLTLSSLYVAFVKQCRAYAWQGVWKNTRQVKLEIGKVRVEPDAWLLVESPNGSAEAFVEFSDELPAIGEMNAKLRGYSALFGQRQAVPILWFTTTLAKRNRLVRMAEKWRYCDYVFFGLVEDKREFLTAKVWHWQGRDGEHWLDTGEASSSLHSPVAEPTC